MTNLMDHRNGTAQHWVTVRPEPVGQFTAQAVGLPDVSVTAATRGEALSQLHELLRDLLASGQLVSICVPPVNFLPRRKDPNDPNEKAYLDALARDRQEDLEQTLRELDKECSNSSSTPTT